jgi:hypothetical protein
MWTISLFHILRIKWCNPCSFSMVPGPWEESAQ